MSIWADVVSGLGANDAGKEDLELMDHGSRHILNYSILIDK